MKLTNYGAESIQETAEYVLRDGDEHGRIVLTLQALPPDYDETSEEELPSPKPEILGVEKDERGRVVMDDDGKPAKRYKDEDPDYRRAVAEHNKLQAVKMILDGIADGQLTFSTTKDEASDAAEFYRTALVEMKQYGFSMGDFIRLVEAIAEVSSIGEEAVREAERVFSGAES